MQKIRKWWGIEIQDDNNNVLGFITKEGFTNWTVVAPDNKTILGEFRLQKDAIAFLLNPPQPETPDVFNRWITTNEILEHMTISEFKAQVFEGHIRIIDTQLGQPRHIKIFGNGFFFLEDAHA